MEDYYKILEISSDAPQEEIKKAYRLLAMMYHPDRHKDTGNEELYKKAEEKFKLIQMAYRALSNPQKRAEYDVQYSEIKRDQEKDAWYKAEQATWYGEKAGEPEEPTEEPVQEDISEAAVPFPTKTLYLSLASLLLVLLGFLVLSLGEAFFGWGIFQVVSGIAGMGIGGWRLWSHDTTGSKITGALFLAPAVIIIGYVALAFLIFILIIWGLLVAIAGGDC